MEGAKIGLSPAALELVQNRELILTKNNILQTVLQLFAGLQQQFLHAQPQQEAGIFSIAPKISRGENYKGLPYVVLDYPRFARGNELCFVRTLFWWGHYFSTTLQLAGRFREEGVAPVAAAYDRLRADWRVSITADPWEHDLAGEHYAAVTELPPAVFAEALRAQPHLKLAAALPLASWNGAPAVLLRNWKLLVDLIA